MRKNCLRTLGLMALLVVTAGLATPRRAQSIPPLNCFLDFQECDTCVGRLQHLCSYYYCDNGPMVVCDNSCNEFCTVPVRP